MEGLSSKEWSLIARYLKEEATASDLVRLNKLLNEYPQLNNAMQQMGRQINQPADPEDQRFNSEAAFQKLHDRLKKEKLI